MGEIAEMMLEGILCNQCGAFVGEEVGYPQYCDIECAMESGMSKKEAKELFS